MTVLDYDLVFLIILAYATFGAIVSSLVGLVVSSVLRVGTGGIKRDAILGAVGFPLAVVGLGMMPWPCHDETHWEDGTMLTGHFAPCFPHPFISSLVVVILISIAHEWFRFRRKNPN